MIYILRRLLMHTLFVEQHARALAQERQLQAEAENRVRRLLAVRRWERKAEKANLQLRLARLSVR
jgi:hypothetical protein